MKKIGIVFSALIMAFLIVIQFNVSTARADDSYKISKYDVNVDVQKNGDADVTQKMKYKFAGNFHGVYYNQDLVGIKSLENPRVEIKGNDGTISLKPSESQKDNTFKVNNSSDNMKITVYHNITNDSATYIYRYKLLGVITNYKDTAELNWKVIGSGWDEPLNNVNIVINLPSNNVSELQAWSHGPLDGFTDVNRDKGAVTMSVKHVDANQFVESHIIFPTSVTSLNTKFVNKNAKSNILKKEKSLAIEANKQRAIPRRIFYVSLLVYVLVIIGIFINIFYQLRKNPVNKHEMPIPLHHWFEVPAVSPSMAQIVIDKADTANSASLTADMLVEVNKRNLEIIKLDKTFEIKANKLPDDKIFQYLINDIGDGEKVTIKQINKSSKSKLSKRFSAWSKRAARGREQFFDKKNTDRISSFSMGAILTSVLSVIMAGIGMVTYSDKWILLVCVLLIGLVFSWTTYFQVKKRISVYTEKGEILANELRGFKQMLKDIDDIKLADVGDLILWEQILPYAVAFGVSDKVIKALKVEFSDQVLNDPSFVYYYWAVAGLSNNFDFTSSISSAINAGNGSNSSIGGSSGGFSGGSSGGFGGGSGGGAF
ncbi:DUF2207 domain-containing protein [Companilactobacillus ginsenosidimutans]|uniref:DUF2207 domain-containing protein n=1 Tax=Companilactobacillus ginsenosidimutans TaxID=1007676 RepID=A0A0H4QEN4_9LACO|nr:DUF2207 domain-containing protein [Companilactobacillus ginsenosidimutans]AKP66849.1 hypothetical protein ABM34_04265 [Companilactobacillus ginsenosidimutans]